MIHLMVWLMRLFYLQLWNTMHHIPVSYTHLLFPLDYMTDAQLKTFYQQEVVPSYYSHIVRQMEQEKHQGYVVIICTASCEALSLIHI